MLAIHQNSAKQSNGEVFIDNADTQEIREAHSQGLIDGVTTNPSLIAKTGRSFNEVVREICSLVTGR